MSAGVTLPPKLLVAAAAACLALTSAASAEDKVKIGIITTLSAAAGAVPGQQQRNGFELAVKTLGGKLGGREAEILVADDELKPDIAVTKVKAFVDRDKVAFVVGPYFPTSLPRS
jgi:branched-chain amino acid transport system substrate-binding protein